MDDYNLANDPTIQDVYGIVQDEVEPYEKVVADYNQLLENYQRLYKLVFHSNLPNFSKSKINFHFETFFSTTTRNHVCNSRTLRSTNLSNVLNSYSIRLGHLLD